MDASENENEQSPSRPTPPARMSRTPSWVMLGFVLGAGFVWLLYENGGLSLGGAAEQSGGAATAHRNGSASMAAGQGGGQGNGSIAQQPEAGQQSASGGAGQASQAAKPKPKPRVLTTVEAVFEEWGRSAVWDNNRTEVALWNSDKGAYSDYYEVFRDEGTYYFRSLTSLTRPLLALPDRQDCPILFTETAAMRRERDAARSLLVPVRPEPPAPNPPPQPVVDAPGQ